jgi:hypothetical protein
MLAFFVAAAAATSIPQALEDFRSCTTNQAVQLGASNSETADTIIRAVRSVCAPQWVSLKSAAGVGLGVATIDGIVLDWRTDAENAAIAALLQARAKRQ